jgi:hypothetical protein
VAYLDVARAEKAQGGLLSKVERVVVRAEEDLGF